MKRTTQVVVTAFTLANFYLLAITGPLVSPAHELIFHEAAPSSRFYVPAVLDVLLVWTALAACLWLSRRHPRLELWLWSALIGALPSALLSTVYGFRGVEILVPLRWTVAATEVALFCAVNARQRKAVRLFERIQPRLALLFAFLGVPALLLCLQLIWYGFASYRAEKTALLAPPIEHLDPAAQAYVGPRVLWIVLDELAYDQVFGRHLPGVTLKHFDDLAQQAIVFTKVAPAAEYTRTAIPALLTGKALGQARPTAGANHLWLVGKGGQQGPFDPQDTIFGDARRAGLPTSIAGWYEPYCRLLPGLLDRCFWIYSDNLPGGMKDGGGILRHTLDPFLHFVQVVGGGLGLAAIAPPEEAQDLQRHRQDYEALLRASDHLLLNHPAGLMLIHMPIPHPWGFYDRRTASFPDHRTSYVDNLALADAYLGRVRAQLEEQGLWDSTTVLVMGDHSWRTTSVWAHSAHWSAEDQIASHGGEFDDRPAVILKLPGEDAGAKINQRFDAVRTRALLDGIVHGRLTTQRDVAAWCCSE